MSFRSILKKQRMPCRDVVDYYRVFRGKISLVSNLFLTIMGSLGFGKKADKKYKNYNLFLDKTE